MSSPVGSVKHVMCSSRGSLKTPSHNRALSYDRRCPTSPPDRVCCLKGRYPAYTILIRHKTLSDDKVKVSLLLKQLTRSGTVIRQVRLRSRSRPEVMGIYFPLGSLRHGICLLTFDEAKDRAIAHCRDVSSDVIGLGGVRQAMVNPSLFGR